MDLVKVVLIAVLVLSIIAIAMFLVLTNLRDTFENTEQKISGSFSNETISSVTDADLASVLTDGVITNLDSFRNCVVTITTIYNATGVTITGGGGNNASTSFPFVVANYTTSACGLQATATSEHNATNWNVSGTYEYNSPDAYNVVGNITEGTGEFFKQVPTAFTLLGVLLIILIVIVVIFAVDRLNGGSMSFGGKGVSSDDL